MDDDEPDELMPVDEGVAMRKPDLYSLLAAERDDDRSSAVLMFCLTISWKSRLPVVCDDDERDEHDDDIEWVDGDGCIGVLCV